ncbi:MAG: Gfo/Idh/MocA family oxidoreductase [Proteobacteria bacterium]|nr:Gfo/Idh/MocA family oxidoreductase [Pseudomonadota bacterium]
MPTDRQTVRVGAIGAGFIADYHLGGLAAAGGADVRVVYGRTLETTRALATRYGIPEVASDWRRVVERKDLDAVVITTPDHTHAEIAIAAAEAGKAILLQKPMATSSAECRRVIAAARAAGVRLQVSFMHRYFEEVVRTREILAEGKAGPVFAVRMRNATPGPDWKTWFFARANVGGGVVMQLGVHGIDVLRHLFGDIVAVSGTTAIRKTERTLADGTVVRPDNEDQALAVYKFRGGLIGNHEMSFSELRGCDRFTLEIYCAEATIWLRSMRGRLALYAPTITGVKDWVVPDLPNPPMGARHHAHFLGIVRGNTPPDTTPEDGLATVLVAEALYRAAERKQEQVVESI